MRNNCDPKSNEIIEFDVRCKMKKCWADEFMSFLKTIEHYGKLGHSEMVAIFADGDGDFRPKFETDFKYEVKDAINAKDKNAEYTLFDAG